MINMFYKEIRHKLPCPFRGHFRDVLYRFRSEVFEHMRLRLVLAHVSGKLEFELRPRRLIKLNEFLDLLDRCNVAFQDSTPISSSVPRIIGLGWIKRSVLHPLHGVACYGRESNSTHR